MIAVAQTALSFLAAAKQAELDPETAAVYLTALSDVDPSALERACRELAKEPRRQFEPAFPTVGKIRETADVIARADTEARELSRLLAMPPRDVDVPTYHCLACFDEPSGWRLFWCSGSGQYRATFDGKPERCEDMDRQPCGKQKSHMPHTFSERCGCIETNPVIRAHRDRMRNARQRFETQRSTS